MDHHLLSNFDGHEVFADFERALIGLSRLRYEIRGLWGGDMRIDGESGMNPGEDGARLFGGGVVRDDLLALLLGERNRSGAERNRINDLVYQKIGSLRELDEVIRWSRVAREHDGA